MTLYAIFCCYCCGKIVHSILTTTKTINEIGGREAEGETVTELPRVASTIARVAGSGGTEASEAEAEATHEGFAAGGPALLYFFLFFASNRSLR